MNNQHPKTSLQRDNTDGMPDEAEMTTTDQANTTTGVRPCPSYADTSTEVNPLPAFVTREMSPSC